MTITDNELCMLEQICYIDTKLVEAAIGVEIKPEVLARKIRGAKGCTIGQILQSIGFDDEAIEKLEAMGNEEIDGACASGREWAEILKYLKESDLKDLVLSETMSNESGTTTLALCFTENGNESEAIVAFKGTSGGEEWKDNVEGLNVSDTECQREALDFIESLPYQDITTIGHSKGGNKAMYVAVTSSKVGRCVSFDGQGFSQEFIDKYWAEIELRGKNITNYSLATDYVHALMFPVPNSNQLYCKGSGVSNVKQHHSPNSFFEIFIFDGKLMLDNNGIPIIVSGIDEAYSIQMLHDFTTFILNNADDENKVVLVNYISKLLSKVFTEGNNDDLVDVIVSDEEALALLLAYLVKYMDVYDLNSEDINELLTTIGLNELNNMITLKELKILGVHIADVNLNLANILDMIKVQLTDGKDDTFIRNVLLPVLKYFLFNDINIDVNEFWGNIEKNVEKIDASKGTENAISRTGVTRDFSSKVYESLMEAVTQIQSVNDISVISWREYADEDWYSSIPVDTLAKGINYYYSKIIEANQSSKAQIDAIFSNVKQIDTRYALKINDKCESLKTTNTFILQLAESIGTK